MNYRVASLQINLNYVEQNEPLLRVLLNMKIKYSFVKQEVYENRISIENWGVLSLTLISTFAEFSTSQHE